MGNKSSASKKFTQEVEGLKCGCYIRRPDHVGVGFDKALVPLRHIDYHLQIANSLLNITLKQTYVNPIDKYLQVDYSIPICPQSSIYSFSVQFNNVKIDGIVKEKQEAKKQFQKAKSEGKQAAIGTIDPDSKDILNLEIGNIPPLTQFVVKISFLQQMKVTQNTFYQLRVPSFISPRYMNKVEGVTKVTEQSILKDKGVSSGKADYDWTFKIDLKTTRKVIFFDSPSHSITMISQNEQGTQTLCVMDKSQVPNQDFTFLYTTQDFQLPSYVLGSTDTSSTVMLSFIPKFSSLEVTDAYKASLQNKISQTDISDAKGDYVFLLDRSGSMGGTRIAKAKQALILFIKSLPEDSYFNIVSFGNSSQRMFQKSQKNSEKAINEAVLKVQNMDADMGGTQIYQPLKSILEEKGVQGYPRQVFLLTDGDVSNTQGVISMVRKNTKFSRVHSIGIGSGASIDLIQGCAKGGKGKSIMISDDQNPSQKIIELLQDTLTPVISKINLKYENQSQIQSIVPNPKSIPYILKNDIANFYVTFNGPLKGNKKFTLEYQDPITKVLCCASIQVSPNLLSNSFVDKMAHLKVLRSLENSAKDNILIQDQMYYVKIKDFKQQAIKYSVKNQILSEYTAFICIGKQLIDGQYQQFKNKGVHMVYVEQSKPKFYEQQDQMNLRSFGLMKKMACPPPPIQMMMARSASPPAQYYKNKMCSMQQQQCQVNDICTNQLDQAEDQCMVYQCSSISKTQNISSKNNDKFGQVRHKMAQTTIVKQQQKKLSDNLTVQDVVKMQAVDGSWSNPQLIDKLSINVAQVGQLAKTISKQIVITKLVVLWLQKNYPQKQYSLIIKKGLSWLKKSITQINLDEQKLQIIKPK